MGGGIFVDDYGDNDNDDDYDDDGNDDNDNNEGRIRLGLRLKLGVSRIVPRHICKFVISRFSE